MRVHYAWLIFLGVCFLGVGGFALVYSPAGIYMLPMSETLSLPESSVSIWLVSDAILEVLMLPVAGRLLQGRHMGLVMTLAAISTILGVFCLALVENVVQIALCGVLIGIGMPFLFTVAQTALIGNWFAERLRPRYLGISMAVMGFSQILWAPLFTSIMLSLGWRTTYMINAAIMAVCLLPWTIFVFKRDPSEKGLLPYGAVLDTAGELAAEDDIAFGMPPKEAFRSKCFWLILVAISILALGYGYITSLPSAVEEMLSPVIHDADALAMLGASMISTAAIGHCFGSLTFGLIAERIGLSRTFAIFLFMYIMSFVFWVALPNTTGLYIGAFLIGTQDGLICVGFPLLVRNAFGNKNYPRIYCFISLANIFVGNLSRTIIALIRETLLDNYSEIFFASIILASIAALCTAFAIRLSRRNAAMTEGHQES